MKILKKLATLLLAVCLVVPCFATVTYAAGSIQFTDPSTKTGEVVEVTCKIKGVTIKDATVSMTYDTNMLKFKDGDNVTETVAGKLTYAGKADSFNLHFDVLKEGTTKIEIADYEVKNTDGDKVELEKGSSAIKIAAGETPAADPEQPTEDPDAAAPTADAMSVTVAEKSYTLSAEFAEADIPEGFAETTMEFNGAQMKFVQQAESGICLGYLVDEGMIGKFFLYNPEDATFTPFEQIVVSDTTVITILTNSESVKLPKEYQKVTLTLNEQDFPVWQNAENLDYYVLYAINNQGEKSLYQFDSVEGTYQRFEAPEVVEEKEEEDTTAFGKLNGFLEKHLDYVILGTGLGFIFFLVLVIVLGVKLYNRNAELDELYEEYDIDAEEDEPVQQVKEEKRGLFGKKKEPEDDDFEDDSFLDEEDFLDEDDEEFVDEEEDDFVEDDEDGFSEEDDTFADEEEEEFFDDDDFEESEEGDSSYDDFDVDFIDLDD